MRRPAAAVGLLVVGAATGVATLAVHSRPWGLPLAVLATLAALLALPRGWWSRVPLVVGWLAPVGAAVLGRPEGDVVLAQDPSGWAVVLLGVALLVVAVGSAPPPRRPRDRGEPAARPAAHDAEDAGPRS